MGRFLQQDPAKDGGNWLAYVENRPTASIDPEGLKKRLCSDDDEGGCEGKCQRKFQRAMKYCHRRAEWATVILTAGAAGAEVASGGAASPVVAIGYAVGGVGITGDFGICRQEAREVKRDCLADCKEE